MTSEDVSIKRIQLTNGGETTVDASDYEWLSQWKWRRQSGSTTHVAYACRPDRSSGKLVNVAMHRVILDAPGGMLVDHVNGNGLDNRRCNLRLATRTQNAINSRMSPTNTSGYRGVYWCKKNKRWQASISVDGKRKHVGCFKAPEDAARAYDKAIVAHYGEFARTNFPR